MPVLKFDMKNMSNLVNQLQSFWILYTITVEMKFISNELMTT